MNVASDSAGSAGAGPALEPRPKLPLHKKALFSLVFLVAFLVAVEVAGRVVSYVVYKFNPYYLLYGFYSWTDESGVGHSEKHLGYFKFPANKVITFGTPEPCRINNHGMRGVDFEAKKAPGTFRVVCLGASSTFGYTNRDEGTYPRILQKLFDAEGLSPRVEVINAGIPHMRARHIRAMFEGEILDYEPDLVTFYEGWNDALHIADESRFQRGCRWLDEHSAAYAGLRKAANKIFGKVLASSWDEYMSVTNVERERAERHARLHAEDVEKNLTELIEAARDHGIQVVLVKQPMTQWYDKVLRGLVTEGIPRSTYEQEYEALEEKLRTKGSLAGWEMVLYVHHAIVGRVRVLAARYGLPLVDNIAIVDERPDRLASFVHLSEEGNARLAEELHKMIRPAVEKKRAAVDAPPEPTR